MKTADFIREHGACHEGADWALSVSSDMSAVWGALVDQGKHEWLIWTATRPGVFSESVLRKLVCRFIRETPLLDGLKVWDLLEDERSRKAVYVAEAYADGNATEAELDAAYAAASDSARRPRAATYAAEVAAYAAADAAAEAHSVRSISYAVYFAAAYAAALSAQVQMIAELGNPFKKESSNENS